MPLIVKTILDIAGKRILWNKRSEVNGKRVQWRAEHSFGRERYLSRIWRARSTKSVPGRMKEPEVYAAVSQI